MLTILSSDAALVARALRGHAGAFETLVIRHQRKAHAVARAQGVPDSSLDDVVQDAFLRAFRDLRGLRDRSAFAPWLAGITRHAALSHLRRRVPRPAGDELPEPSAPAGDVLEGEELRDELRRRVLELPEGVREAVLLYYYEDRSVREAARTLGTSRAAVRKRLQKGREILRERLWRGLGIQILGGRRSPGEWRARGRELALLCIAGAPVVSGSGGPAVASEGTETPDRPEGEARSPPDGAPTWLRRPAPLVGGAAAIVLAALAVGIAIRAKLPRYADPEPTPGMPEESSRSPVAAAAVAPEISTPAPPASTENVPNRPPGAGLRGVVVDDDGQPVPDAVVTVRSKITPEEATDLRGRGFEDVEEGPEETSTRTDPSGRYAFDGLLPDHVVIEAAKDGTFMDGCPDIDLESGRAAWQELHVHPLRRIVGSILDAEGYAVPDAVLLIGFGLCEEDRPAVGEKEGAWSVLRSDATGAFDTGPAIRTTHDLPAERLGAWARGFAFTQATAEFGDGIARIDFRLESELPVTLVVSGPAGEPVSGAAISVCTESGSPRGDHPRPVGRSDERGRVAVEHLAPRAQALQVSKEGHAVATIEVGPDRSGEIAVTLVQLGAELVARFVSPDGTEVSGGTAVALQSLGDDGAFRIADSVRPRARDSNATRRTFLPGRSGVYRFAYEHEGRSYATEAFTFDAAVPLEVLLPVDAPSADAIRAKRRVCGRVVEQPGGPGRSEAVVEAAFYTTDDRPSPWEGAFCLNLDLRQHFRFPPPPGEVCAAEVDAEGRFALDVPLEPDLTVTVWARSATPWYHDPRSAKVWWSRAIRLHLAPGEAATEVQIPLAPGGRVEGRAAGPDGEPVVGEAVVLYGRPVLLARLSNDEGRFWFDGVPEGAYVLESLGPASRIGITGVSGPPAPPGLPSPENFFEFRLRVRDLETVTPEIRVLEDRLATVRGEGPPAAPEGCRVRFAMAVGDGFVDWMPFGGDVPLESGRFEARGLFPGRYRFQAEAWILNGQRGQSVVLGEAEAVVERGTTLELRLLPLE